MSTPTFYPFPRLPKELRLEIWKLLIPEPRIIQFSLKQTQQELSTLTFQWVASTTPLSSCLRDISIESQEIFYRSYHTINALDSSDGATKLLMDVDYDRDTFYFGSALPAKPPTESLGFASEPQDGTAIGFERAKIVVLDMNIVQKPFYREMGFSSGFDFLCQDTSQGALKIIEDVVVVFPYVKELYFIVNPVVAMARKMIKLQESDAFSKWMLRFQERLVDWLPGVVKEANATRGVGNELKIEMRLFEYLDDDYR